MGSPAAGSRELVLSLAAEEDLFHRSLGHSLGCGSSARCAWLLRGSLLFFLLLLTAGLGPRKEGFPSKCRRNDFQAGG